MALSNDDRARIREEEMFRLQVAEEFRRMHQKSRFTEPRMIGFSIFAVVLAGLLFSLMRFV